LSALWNINSFHSGIVKIVIIIIILLLLLQIKILVSLIHYNNKQKKVNEFPLK